MVEFPLGLVAPGFVNAHAHLELGGYQGRLVGDSMVAWIQSLIAVRGEVSPAVYAREFGRGVERSLGSGTTTVGDIDSSGVCAEKARASGARFVCFREVLDAGDPTRAPTALRPVQRGLGKFSLVREGLSPHAPYTTSLELLRGCARLRARRALPLAVHWAETREEREWIEAGQGPFKALLPPAAQPLGRSALEVLDELGLLGPFALLIHGNDPRREELLRIRKCGASVVHCPGTHRYFDREPFPLKLYRDMGIPIALGTDSLASNEDLDMGRELELARQAFPDLEPAELFRWATEGGARALGLAGKVGRLAPGYAADFCVHGIEPENAREACEGLCAPARTQAVFVAGRLVQGVGA